MSTSLIKYPIQDTKIRDKSNRTWKPFPSIGLLADYSFKYVWNILIKPAVKDVLNFLRYSVYVLAQLNVKSFYHEVHVPPIVTSIISV